MKQIIILITALLLANRCAAQKIQFKLYGLNTCTKINATFSFYGLKSDKVYFPKDTDGICILPDTGTYKLNVYNDIRTYHFSEYKFYRDTIELPSIEFLLITFPKYGYIYEYCGKPADGQLDTYFPNGKIRVKGNFVLGQGKGKITFYYSNGQIQEIRKYRRDGRFLWSKEFDEYGVLVGSSNNKPVKIK